MERPIFFSLLIIISAYIPLFTLERVERRLFTPMAFTVCYALLGSMLLALTLIPVLATYLFRHGAKSWDNPVLRLARATVRARAGWCAAPVRWWSSGCRAAIVVAPSARRCSGYRVPAAASTKASSGSARIFPPGISLDESARDGRTDPEHRLDSIPK